eukprot:GHUV01038019.1.p1 GENE.GHUV01038019.1~~GHUV01038019.1.p1  ORF type:complete len:273 (+),score=40.50 GHUV01038019.1:111-929(+)
MRLTALSEQFWRCSRGIVFCLIASTMAAAAAGLLQLDDVDVQHKPYHQHIRQRVIALRYSQVPYLSAEKISAALGGKPCASTCQNIITQHAIDGSTSLNGSRGIRHADRKGNEVARELLLDLVTTEQDALLQELVEQMEQLTHIPWTVPEISKMLHEMGFVRVKVTQNAKEANAATQAKWRDLIQSLCIGPQHMVFVDEVAAVSSVALGHLAATYAVADYRSQWHWYYHNMLAQHRCCLLVSWHCTIIWSSAVHLLYAVVGASYQTCTDATG